VIQGLMENNGKNLLLSELSSANAYIERIFHSIFDVANIGHHQDVLQLCQKLYIDLMELFEKGLLKSEFLNENPHVVSSKMVRVKCQKAGQIIEGFLHLDINQDELTTFSVDFINLMYEYSYQLHFHCAEVTNLEIQYPRVNLIEMFTANPGRPGPEEEKNQQYLRENNEKVKPLFNNILTGLEGGKDQLDCNEIDMQTPSAQIPKFFLPLESVLEISKSATSITSLQWQRDKKYDELVRQGHEFIFKKEIERGLISFQKANNYKETAEILTLIGWCYSLLRNFEKAKTLCLRAIQKDPDYGPPYNDLGTYLLSEGQINESLKWFSLAKKSLHYQNREYPYINAGRAYMVKKDFAKALQEFSQALTLAPYHEELHKTVAKLKSSLAKTTEKRVANNNGDHLANINKRHLFNADAFKKERNNEPPPSVL